MRRMLWTPRGNQVPNAIQWLWDTEGPLATSDRYAHEWLIGVTAPSSLGLLPRLRNE
jgi:hypothetical protein